MKDGWNQLQTLAEKVAEMRKVQIEFFATGRRDLIGKAKGLERQVDTMVARILDGQQELFERGETS